MNNLTETTNTSSSEDIGKILLVIRHAKSSWDISTLNDFDRPLNERGKREAPMMAKRLIDKKIKVDAFVSSPAKRAKKTAELFCETFGSKPGEVVFISMLYQAAVEDFYDTVKNLDSSLHTVAIFSHNPGITAFVNTLTETVQIDNIPTCGIFAVKARTDKWADFKKAKKEYLFFDYPKLS